MTEIPPPLPTPTFQKQKISESGNRIAEAIGAKIKMELNGFSL